MDGSPDIGSPPGLGVAPYCRRNGSAAGLLFGLDAHTDDICSHVMFQFLLHLQKGI